MDKIKWVIDYPLDTADPQDGGPEITYWWEDMRAHEVLELIQDVYKRGYERGVKESVSASVPTKTKEKKNATRCKVCGSWYCAVVRGKEKEEVG